MTLKPCPWCGGPARIRGEPFVHDGFVVGCEHDGAADPDLCGMAPQSLPFVSAETAAAAWNARRDPLAEAKAHAGALRAIGSNLNQIVRELDRLGPLPDGGDNTGDRSR